MKIAIVVDYLNVYGGGERTLEAVLEIYPQTTLFTSLYDPSKFGQDSPIRKAKVMPFFSSHLLILTSYFLKHFTFVMPFFFQRINLSGFELVISVGTIWAKGIKTNHNQTHIFYCLTPPRFLYGYPSASSKRNVWYYRPLTTLIDHFLRIWDFEVAQKPDEILVISEEVRRRVRKFYRRDSVVVYPPVRVEASGQRLEVSGGREEVSHPSLLSLASSPYFLIVSRLAAYKRIDVAIAACNFLNLPLKIVGTGREEKRLKMLAGSLTEFLGFRSDQEIDELYRNCTALIFPTPDEDFGLVPVEANAAGIPVIAHRSGGVMETMIEGKTAVFYNEDRVESLVQALKNFDRSKFLTKDCVENAQRFSRERFRQEFKILVNEAKPFPH